MESAKSSPAARLDQQVARQLPDISRSTAAKLIESAKVKVDGRVITKPSYKITSTEKVEVDFSPQNIAVPQIDLPVIYEDRSCVVINKPVGILAHSKGAINYEATVATWLSSRITGLSGNRAGIVHRLDRATSGVMICAKNPEALAWLQKQFSQRKAKKEYEAIVSGSLEPAEAIIDMPIERNPKKPQTFRVGANGKPAVTLYETVRSADALSLLKLRPETGRTHQLRVHLSQLGHPILGDALYGGRDAQRLYLHASKLELTLPNKQRVVFEAPLPAEFKEVMA